jgi:ribosome-binding protein aMBF1 (putative translation factor)
MTTTKCPICDWDMQDGGIKVQVAGREITVCCDECAAKAVARAEAEAGSRDRR